MSACVRAMSRRSSGAALVLALGACGDNLAPGGVGDDAAPAVDAATDAPSGLVSCALDLPGVLPRPPSGGMLPCELLPPGFVGP
jgi:hypothetical protein